MIRVWTCIGILSLLILLLSWHSIIFCRALPRSLTHTRTSSILPYYDSGRRRAAATASTVLYVARSPFNGTNTNPPPFISSYQDYYNDDDAGAGAGADYASGYYDSSSSVTSSSLSSSSVTNREANRFTRICSLPRQNAYELQTKVRRYRRVEEDGSVTTVDLHAMVHYGDASYFEYYNSMSNGNDDDEGKEEKEEGYDYVLYELIVSDELVEGTGVDRSLVVDVAPSLDASQMALQFGLSCQLDVVNYATNSRNVVDGSDRPCEWICADVSKEYLEYRENSGRGKAFDRDGSTVPLEILEALVKPVTPSKNNDGLQTKLFSNLFLAGDFISSLLRLVLWVVPVPELSVLLLDWSSLSPRPGGLSPVATQVIECIARGDFGTAKKLVFTQMIVSGQAVDYVNDHNSESSSSFIVGERNNLALNVLNGVVKKDTTQKKTVGKDTRIALLFGAMHCRDLQRKIYRMGFTKITSTNRPEWRTAWRVSLPMKNFHSVAGTAVLIPLYFAVGGLDWYSTIVDAARDADSMNGLGASTGVALYLARHVILYFSLARFVLEWDNSLFNSSDGKGSETTYAFRSSKRD